MYHGLEVQIIGGSFFPHHFIIPFHTRETGLWTPVRVYIMCIQCIYIG